jgi:DNA repair exonuclease SbcCD nuclease subunit
MKILVVGDPHFMVGNLPVMSKLCSEILSVIDERKPDLFVNLGDTLHTHERLHIRPITAACNFMLEVAKRCPTVMIIGNHDRENNSDFQTDIHPFNGLKAHPNITVVDRTIWDRERNFIYVPYVAPGRFREALGTAGWTPDGPQPELCFAHQEFLGSVDGQYISDKGDSWSRDMFQVISGHIHKFQILPGVFYVGTPIQHNFGDLPDNALLMIHIDDETKEKKYERIPILNVPKKVVLHFTKEDLDDFHSKIPVGYRVKVFLFVNDNESAAIQKDPRYLALVESVEAVQIKTNNEKMSLAAQAMSELSVEDQLSLEEVILKMLQDDPVCQQIFLSEIVA